MPKKIGNLLLLFLFGVAGGIFANQILWPYFIERPLFYQYRLEQPPVYLTENKQYFIQEGNTIQEAVERVQKSIVGISLKTGKTLLGSGLVLTSDGLMITLSDILPQQGDLVFNVNDKTPAYQILRKDVKNNLALVKLESNGLATVGLADFGNVRLGERVFLLGEIKDKEGIKRIVNEGIISFIDNSVIKTNISEKNILQGSVLFNLKGEVVGINDFNSGGFTIIPVKTIREFTGI